LESLSSLVPGTDDGAVPKLKSLLPFFADHCKVPRGVSLWAY
jgi:hypothetical protein